MPKEKFKFYTHHFTSMSLEGGASKQKKESGLFLFFFHVGNFVIRITRMIYGLADKLFRTVTKTFKKDLADTALSFKKRLRIFHSREFARGFLLFVVFSLFGWGLFRGAALLATALNLKDSIFSGAQAGVAHMTQAGQDLAAQNTAAAGSEFTLAYNSFITGKQQLEQGSSMIADVLNVLPQTKSARNVLDAAALVSKGGQELVTFYNTIAGLSFSVQGLESSGGNTAETLKVMDDALNNAGLDIAAANQKIAAVDVSIIPSSKKDEFAQAGASLIAAQTALTNVKDVFAIVEKIILPKSTVLILFENNNELRPGGGFIGTYGAAAFDNGKINSLNISSIYDLDGQLKTRISPPNPLLNLNDRWYLRDSNWFADFPTSARKATDFYEMEGGETPSTVIALTPSVITALLQITGPVSVPTFNTSLTADNFVEKTQAISTISDGLSLNQPKQILADFFPLFIQKLKTLTADQGKQVLVALLKALQEKQIVLESSDSSVQSNLENFNWAGKVFDSDRDYLQMVSANLGGTKTDLSLQKKLDLQTTIDSKGTITDDLTVTITNQMPKMDGTENTSFIRFLAPQGSKLLSMTGFDTKNLDSLQNKDYRQDPDVAAWENGMVKDIGSGTLIGNESGKTFFGNWLTVLGGETKIIHITYTLPFKLQSPDRYSLVLQKQVGSLNNEFNWTVHFNGKKLQWENFVPDNIEANNLTKSISLDKDYFFGMVLEDR